MGEVKVAFVIVFLIAATTLLHLQVLVALRRGLPRLHDRPALGAVVMIIGLLLVHLAEVFLFAFGYAWCIQWASLGTLEGDLSVGWRDYVYFSGSAYTTMGFGDIVPRGPVRLIAGMEALTGLLMMAWSGSFTFLQMQRLWGIRLNGGRG